MIFDVEGIGAGVILTWYHQCTEHANEHRYYVHTRRAHAVNTRTLKPKGH